MPQRFLLIKGKLSNVIENLRKFLLFLFLNVRTIFDQKPITIKFSRLAVQLLL